MKCHHSQISQTFYGEINLHEKALFVLSWLIKLDGMLIWASSTSAFIQYNDAEIFLQITKIFGYSLHRFPSFIIHSIERYPKNDLIDLFCKLNDCVSFHTNTI